MVLKNILSSSVFISQGKTNCISYNTTLSKSDETKLNVIKKQKHDHYYIHNNLTAKQRETIYTSPTMHAEISDNIM